MISRGLKNMGKNKMNSIFVLAVLLAALFAVNAYALPDNPPTCSLSSNVQSTESAAVLTTVSVDTLSNPGVVSIKLFEDNQQIEDKNCGATTTCVSTKTVVHTGGGARSYHAVCRDKAGQETRSNTVSVTFAGLNRAPIITSASPANPVAINEDQTVNFQIAAQDPDGDALTYEWKVDGSSVSSGSTSFDFQRDVSGTSQTFTVTVYVKDGKGGVAVQAWQVVVTDLVPVVSMTSDTGLTECDDFTFNIVVDSYDAYQYSIDFGDGSAQVTGIEAVLTHQFPEQGAYTVTIAVADSDGDTASQTIFVDVTDVSPTVDAGADVTITEGTLAAFDATASMPCELDSITTIDWDFGDGSTESGNIDTTHNYTADGTYTATLTVCDDDGSCTSDTLIVTVEDTEPTAGFTFSPATPTEGDTVSFTDTSSSYDPITGYAWDFDGDGLVDDNTQNPTWAYGLEGTYDACVTVSSADGDSDDFCQEITVSNNPPTNSLELNATSGVEPLDVYANCTGLGGNAPLSASIDFGDGNIVSGFESAHQFVQNGTYAVICTVTDVDGDAVNSTVSVTVSDSIPVVDFYWSPLAPVTSNPVAFYSNITSYETYTVEWEFGDGTTDTLEDTTHTYTLGGDYVITLIVTDSDGSEVSVTKIVHISAFPPTIDMSVTPATGIEPLVVNVNCSATGIFTPFTYDIDFGDGTAHGTTESALHAYMQNGTYNVTCNVTNTNRDSAQESMIVVVDDSVPIVSFNYTPIAPIEKVDVNFDATIDSHDIPATVEWDFGDGDTALNVEDPIHMYDNDGTYTVILTVTDADGSVTVVSQDIVVAMNAPNATLLSNVTSGLEPLSVNFGCSVVGGDLPYAFSIDLGDGTVVTTPTVSHTYNQSGLYSVTCTVTDIDGDLSTSTVAIDVQDSVPTVSFVFAPASPTEGDTVTFTSTVSAYDVPVTYNWDFGDGTSSTDGNDTHTYAIEGDYNVTLTVTDSDGSSAVAWSVVSVSNNAPVLNLIASPMSGLEGLNVSFNCTTAGGNAPLNFLMDFGDGTSGSSSVSDHIYTLPGNYVATCTVTDTDGDVDSDFVIISVNNNAPLAVLTASPTSGLEGDTVDFDCAIGGGNAPFTTVIEFGDGTSIAATNGSHQYLLEGIFNSTCTVTDADGDVSVDSELITIANNAPVVNLVTNVTSGVEQLDVLFNCTVGAGNLPFNYLIDFGDGTTSASATASHSYASNRTIDASCTVTDVDGDVNSDLQTITVFDTEPVANFSFTPASPLEGNMVQFQDLSTAYDGVVGWAWDFGDGNTSTLQNPTHTYPASGSYIVVMTVTDGDGSQTSKVLSVSVGNNVPVVDVIVTPIAGVAPLTVAVDCAVTSGGNAPFTYSVLYGDGQSSTSASSVHTFTTNGVYPVVCEVTDVDADVGTDVQTVNVTLGAPIISGVTAVGATNVSANITWTTDQLTDSLVEYGTTVAMGSTAGNAALVTSHNMLLSGLLPSTTYYYNVTSCNTLFVCSESGPFNFTTTSSVDLTAPAPVTGLGETGVGVDWLAWSWTNPADADFSHVELWVNGSFLANTSALTYNVTGLVPNTTYQIEVITVDTSNNRNAPGVTDIATTAVGADVTAPAAVTGLNESGVGADWLAWSWTNPADIDFNHVELWLNGSFLANTSASSYNVTGLSPAVAYQIEVITVDNVGNRNAPGVTDTATTVVSDLLPTVTASASPTSGNLPLIVQFNATVASGNAPFTFAWDFESDGTVDSTAQNPLFIYNLAGGYTATVTVTDADGDVDTDTEAIVVSSASHDVAVTSITDSKVGSTAYLWDVIAVTSNIQNQGALAETVTVQLEVDGVVVDTDVISVASGATVPVVLSYNATTTGYNNVVVRAVPVAGETDLADQSQQTSIRVWSVADAISTSTREVFLTTTVIIAGGSFTEYLPLQNDYGVQAFDDLRAEIWSSNIGAFSVASPVQLIDLAGGEMELVQWSITANTPGTYFMGASLGNNEIDNTMIVSKMITVV